MSAHDILIDNSFEITRDVLVRCNHCGHRHTFNRYSAGEETWSEEANMGTRTGYKYIFESECEVCGNQLCCIIRFSEYPAGSGSIEGEPEFELIGCKIIGKPIEVEYINSDYSLFLDSPYIPTIIHHDHFIQQANLEFILVNGHASVCDKANDNYRNRSLTIEIPAKQKLLDILVDETGTIRFDDNRVVFASFIGSNPKESAMKLLGKVAEAEIVRGCHNNSVLNKKWLDKARKGFSINATANRFFPIGTGLHSTKRVYPQKYNPSDSQRDIIWMDSKKNVANMVRSSTVSGVQAGLQVKVSTNGVKYVQPDLERRRYEVPVVYFPKKMTLKQSLKTWIEKHVKD